MLPKHALYQMSYTEKNGGGDRHRTCDSLLAKQVLYQLSYTPENENWWIALESNQVCPKTDDLQSPAFTNDARNPKTWSLVRDSNSRRPASKAGALSMLS